MKTNLFDALDLISTIPFLESFKSVLDRNGIHEGAVMFLLEGFMKKQVATTLSLRIVLHTK